MTFPSINFKTTVVEHCAVQQNKYLKGQFRRKMNLWSNYTLSIVIWDLFHDCWM